MSCSCQTAALRTFVRSVSAKALSQHLPPALGRRHGNAHATFVTSMSLGALALPRRLYSSVAAESAEQASGPVADVAVLESPVSNTKSEDGSSTEATELPDAPTSLAADETPVVHVKKLKLKKKAVKAVKAQAAAEAAESASSDTATESGLSQDAAITPVKTKSRAKKEPRKPRVKKVATEATGDKEVVKPLKKSRARKDTPEAQEDGEVPQTPERKPRARKTARKAQDDTKELETAAETPKIKKATLKLKTKVGTRSKDMTPSKLPTDALAASFRAAENSRKSDYEAGYDSFESGPPEAQTEKQPTWGVQKSALQAKFPEGWQPRKKLSPDALAGIRALHAQYPEHYPTEVLAARFAVSPEAIRRILRSRWRPSAEEEEDRQKRWFERGKKVWARWAEEGKKPPRRWRIEGVTRAHFWNTDFNRSGRRRSPKDRMAAIARRAESPQERRTRLKALKAQRAAKPRSWRDGVRPQAPEGETIPRASF